MRTRPFGSTGVEVPVIGQGTWDMERADRAAAIAALRAGVDAGLAHVDTAEMYGAGAVESILGEALEGIRDRVFLVSKVLPQNASRAGTARACEGSLRRLRTDRLDLYLVHWPGPHPLEDTVAALEALREAGKVRAWGVSNFDGALLEETARAAGRAGAIACDQCLHHLEERAAEHSVIPWCERNGAAFVAYSPFGSGRFPSPRSKGGRALAEVAEARGASPRQVALAFLVRRPSVFAIPRTFVRGHVLDNAAAGDLVLDDEEAARLDAAFPRGPEPRELPTI